MTTNMNAWNEMFNASQKMMTDWMDAFLNRGSNADDKKSDENSAFNNYYYWIKFQEMWM